MTMISPTLSRGFNLYPVYKTALIHDESQDK